MMALAGVPTPQPMGGRWMVLSNGAGQLWAALADHLLLEVRAGLMGKAGTLRIAVPVLATVPLYPRATRRFDYSLGERDLGPVTLPVLLVRYLEVGGSIDLLVTVHPDGAVQFGSERETTRLVGRYPRFRCRRASSLDAVLVVAEGFSLTGSAAAFSRGAGAGDVGMVAVGKQFQREFASGFEGLWRLGKPWEVGGRDAG